MAPQREYTSEKIQTLIRSNSKTWRWSIDDFADYLAGQGFIVEIDREQGLIGILFFGDSQASKRPWGCMMRASDGEVHIVAVHRIEDEGIRFTPEFYGDLPKFIEKDLIDLFSVEGYFVKFPEPVVTMKFRNWTFVESGQTPPTSTILALVSEVPAIAERHQVADFLHEQQ